METKQRIKLERATPESLGIDLKGIREFLDDVKKSDIELHSFMVLRHGKVGAEGWFAPYNPDTPHTLYSFSKSMTSTAVGFAVCEGLLKLDDKVISFFPDKQPKRMTENSKNLTIRHLLTMQSGKKLDYLADKGKIDWIQNFLDAPFKYKPGTKFEYTNENIYMLCAILTRVTGQSVVEFLTPRLFEPLDIDVPYWETDPNGIESGGWGLYLKTEDMAKFILTYQQHGKFGGKQVIPEYWAREATKKQVDNSGERDIDGNKGYGYNFWRCNCPNAYRADGMFAQLGIVLEDYDACVITTAAIPDVNQMLRAIFRHFPHDVFKEDVMPENPELDASFKKQMEQLSLPTLGMGKRYPETEKEIEDRVIKTHKNKESVLSPVITFMSADKAGNINNMKFNFGEDECSFSWTEGKESCSVPVGMDGKYRYGTMVLGGIKFTSCSVGKWKDDHTLEIWVRPLESAAMRKMTFTFSGDRVRIFTDGTPTMGKVGDFVANQVGYMIGGKLMIKPARAVVQVLIWVLDPNVNGRLDKTNIA